VFDVPVREHRTSKNLPIVAGSSRCNVNAATATMQSFLPPKIHR
jgi:hypothetical protein